METVPRPPSAPRNGAAAPRGKNVRAAQAPGPDIRSFNSNKPEAPPDDSGDLPLPPSRSSSEVIMEAVEVNPLELHIDEMVGSGMTAEVFKGTLNGETVAIKQFLQCRHRAIKEQVALAREVLILTKITHPNLVRLFGITVSTTPNRIITEFCDGGTCFELLHNEREISLVWGQQYKMICDIACAMNYLHGRDPMIVHRDLKSLNLLLAKRVRSVTDSPVVKVSDFGLSRVKDEDKDWGKMTNKAGTPHWMAPEVYCGTTYDEKVDIYSYAMCLFEVICRAVPFEEFEAAQIGPMVTTGGRPDLTLVPDDCPKALRELMTVCWSASPIQRPNFKTILEILRRVELPAAKADPRCKRGGLAKTSHEYKSISL